MSGEEDPRIYFAAERTLLAWVRTGLAVIGLGFVVARFGLFLRMMRQGPEVQPGFASTLIGVALVALGSAAIGISAWRNARFCRTLGPESRPDHYGEAWTTLFAVMIVVAGVALAGYLVIQR